MIEDIKKACQVMSEGGVILYPTDTIWGIGCDATNEDAVRRVYEIKQRSDSKAMLVLVDSSVKVDFYVRDVPEVAWDLIDLADKPLTIIYSGARNLAPNLLAEDGSVGIRVTSGGIFKTALSAVPQGDSLFRVGLKQRLYRFRIIIFRYQSIFRIIRGNTGAVRHRCSQSA